MVKRNPKYEYYKRPCLQCGKMFKRTGKFAKHCDKCREEKIRIYISEKLTKELNRYKTCSNQSYEQAIWRILKNGKPIH